METTTVPPVKTRCAECCVRCLGGVPYASLLATLLCLVGVALFCGCGHEGLSNSLALLDSHFQFPHDDQQMLFQVVDVIRYAMYGSVASFLLIGILLFSEGFFTTGAVNGRHGDFKTTTCGRCISAMFIGLTYVLTLLWVTVLGVSSLPVFLTVNVWSACRAAMATAQPSLKPVCVDLRQFGILPWNHSSAVLCEEALENMCNSEEFILAHHLFIVAYAGAAATVIAMIHYLMVLTANWGYVKMSGCASVPVSGPAVACPTDTHAEPGHTQLGDIHNGQETVVP